MSGASSTVSAAPPVPATASAHADRGCSGA